MKIPRMKQKKYVILFFISVYKALLYRLSSLSLTVGDSHPFHLVIIIDIHVYVEGGRGEIFPGLGLQKEYDPAFFLPDICI